MRLPVSLFLPFLVCAAKATPETVKVYIFQTPAYSASSTSPILTQEEAKLVIAQRLGDSQRYNLNDASSDALGYINAFGGPQKHLFGDDGKKIRSQLLIVMDNATPEIAARYQKEWAPTRLAFEISTPTSRTANEQLNIDMGDDKPLTDLQHYCWTTRNNVPSNKKCWLGKSKVLQFNAASEQSSSSPNQKISEILSDADKEAMDVIIVLMPKSRHLYDLYDMPARLHRVRSAQFEEPIEDSETPPVHESSILNQGKGKKNTMKPGTYSTCYPSNKTCNYETNTCSGHGRCYMSYNNSDSKDESCYACRCVTQINGTELAKKTHWGGAACQKEDVSSPFWLLVGVTVVLMGIVSAGIGMLFSIGEEKLPSVIGAGVSGSKAR